MVICRTATSTFSLSLRRGCAVYFAIVCQSSIAVSTLCVDTVVFISCHNKVIMFPQCSGLSWIARDLKKLPFLKLLLYSSHYWPVACQASASLPASRRAPPMYLKHMTHIGAEDRKSRREDLLKLHLKMIWPEVKALRKKKKARHLQTPWIIRFSVHLLSYNNGQQIHWSANK